MVTRHEFKKEQVRYVLENGEFSSEVTGAAPRVIIIMTQDWCPQWKELSSWVYRMETGEDVAVFEMIYNRVDYQKEFMDLKENRWKNELIPYLRYYRDGKLVDESNYISEKRIRSKIGI